LARQGRLRRFLTTVVVPLVAGAAVTVGGLVWLAGSVGVPLIAPPAVDRGDETSAVTAEPQVRENVPPANRDVTPEGVTPLPSREGPLVRVAPDAVKRGGAVQPETTFRRVVVIDGGRFRTIRDKQPVVVRLDGIVPPAFADTCTDPDGRVWKCGARARAELSRLIRNRSVACVVTDDSNPDELVARCRIGARDISEWLASGGWADADVAAPATVQDAAAEARRARKGRFGPAPSGIIAG
jgi:endonuclease YncB( thermonuclease family)